MCPVFWAHCHVIMYVAGREEQVHRMGAFTLLLIDVFLFFLAVSVSVFVYRLGNALESSLLPLVGRLFLGILSILASRHLGTSCQCAASQNQGFVCLIIYNNLFAAGFLVLISELTLLFGLHCFL